MQQHAMYYKFLYDPSEKKSVRYYLSYLPKERGIRMLLSKLQYLHRSRARYTSLDPEYSRRRTDRVGGILTYLLLTSAVSSKHKPQH